MNLAASSRSQRLALLAATLGAAGSLGAAIFDPARFYAAWLTGFATLVGLPVGALMLSFAHDLTGGGWGRELRRPLTAIGILMPAGALAFLPLLPGLSHLYPWMRPEIAVGLGNRFYLNPTFFLVRALAYFGAWLVLAFLVARQQEDRAGSGAAAPALIALALTTSFSAFDWTMSLEPRWSSSIYGLITVSSGLLAALALATLIACRRVTPERLSPERRRRFGDLGSLLIAGTLLWAYLNFMQFLIVWEGNLPDEAGWYLRRLSGGWRGLATLVFLCETVLPLGMLVWWPLKRDPRWLAAASASILLGYAMFQCWLILPATEGGGIWGLAASWLALGGIASFCLGLPLSRRLAQPCAAASSEIGGHHA